MTIILQPLSAPENLAFTDDGRTILRPVISLHEDCQIRLKQRHIRSEKGQLIIAHWPLWDNQGQAINLTEFMTELTTDPNAAESLSASLSLSLAPEDLTFVVKARFMECEVGNSSPTIYEITGDFVDSDAGLVSFQFPDELACLGGVFRFQVGVLVAGTTRPLLLNKGLWSNESGLWGDTTTVNGIPSLMEIRNHLRDTPVENDLLDDVEFDDDEIVMAMVAPIQQWNETPPPVAYYSCRSFPFRYHWRQAIIGELMRTAAHHYLRNELRINHGGLSGNFKDKHREYLQLAQLYKDEWDRFVVNKKIEINVSGAAQGLGSLYDNHFYNW